LQHGEACIVWVRERILREAIQQLQPIGG